MAGGDGNGLMPGGMGLGLTSADIVNAPAASLALSPDLAFDPSRDVGVGGIYRGMYNPLAPIGVLAGSARPAPTPQSNFDIAFGDSIAAQQISSNIPGVGARRIWGWSGPQYDAKNPAPFNVWETAGVGDPASRIRARAVYALTQNPNFFDNKNVFLPIGSNVEEDSKDNLRGLSAVKDMLNMLAGTDVGSVVIPGVGPGVRNADAWNTVMKKTVEGMNDPRFAFFQPSVQWAGDRVHPNSQQMFDQASAVLNRTLASLSPPTSPTEQTTQPEQAPATGPPTSLIPPPPSTAPNALSPPAPTQAAPYTPYTGPHADIYNHALYHGVDPELALTVARIESNFDPNANINKPTQYKGIFQLGRDEWREMGGTEANRWDPTAQVNLGVARLAQIQQQLADRLGRVPTNAEIYLAHQQGVAGAPALINNPNVPAVQVLQSIGVEPGKAHDSIVGNIGSKDAFGNKVDRESFANAPASKFVQYWNDMYEARRKQIGDAPAYAGAPSIVPRIGQGPRSGGTQIVSYPVGGMPGVPADLQSGMPGVEGIRGGGVPATVLGPLMIPATAPGAETKVAGVGGPYRPKPEGGGVDDALVRRMMLMSALGQVMQGRKFTPISYDPFKVQEAGKEPLLRYSTSIGLGGLGTSIDAGGGRIEAPRLKEAPAASPTSIRPTRASSRVSGAA